MPPQEEMLVLGCMLCCHTLLGGERLDKESLVVARVAREELGGVLGRIPLELQGFLFDGKAWELTCSQLEPLRLVFREHDSEETFDRIWSLALTNETDPDVFGGDIELQDCAHRATSAFEQLWGCLDDRKRSPGSVLRTIAQEAERHGASPRLRKAYEKLLRTAVASVHAPAARQASQLEKLSTEIAEAFDLAQREEAVEAWWACGRVFLREVLRRLQTVAGVSRTAPYAELAKRLLDAPQAAVELARNGSPEALRTVHLGGTAGDWRAYLEREIDVGKLPFDERIRYEIARLKLLRTQAVGAHDEGASLRELLSSFQSLQALLARGVPPQLREIPAALGEPLLDYYVDMLDALRCEVEALRVTEDLLRGHPEDFRLACLYATGAILKGEHFRLSALAKQVPSRHVAPELFARCVRKWSLAPRGMKAAATLSAAMFDPLDREDRKQLLIALSKQALRRASSQGEYSEELAHVLPYFPRDSFVFGELREKVALESSLVFLATMIAPLHSLKLALTEEQSQQWVSHAREIARQSPLGSELALRHLRNPSRGFTLAPAVLASARAQLADFKPASQVKPPPAPDLPRPKKRRRRSKEKDPSLQPGLFDALDP
jgi:hypothetical protein